MCSIQATNSPRSRGRSGSRTRWIDHPAAPPPRRVLLAAAREHVHVDALGGAGSRPACARGAPARPRSAAGTPRTGSGRASGRGRGGPEVEVRREIPQPRVRRGRGVSPERQARRRGRAMRGSQALARVVAGQLAGGHERPIARLQREQLARGAREPARRRRDRRRRRPFELRSPGRRTRSRPPAASPRSTGPCRCPSSTPRAGARRPPTRSRPLVASPGEALARRLVEHRGEPHRPLVPPVAEQLGVERAAEQPAAGHAAAARSTKSRACSRASAAAASRS